MTDNGVSSGWVNGGRAWGLLGLAGLFGAGGFFLFRKSLSDAAELTETYRFAPALVYGLYALLAVIGLVKGEIIFRRKVINRALARGRQAIGETGWAGDAPLAPFCMLSLYRPWKPAHAISSWVIIPAMVGLALLFRFGLPSWLGEETGTLLRGPVYFGIGLALAYGAAVYLAYLARFIGWWASDGKPETLPLPDAQPST